MIYDMNDKVGIRTHDKCDNEANFGHLIRISKNICENFECDGSEMRRRCKEN